MSSSPTDFSSTHDDILDAIANVHLTSPSALSLRPTSLSGEFLDSRGGLVNDNIQDKDKDKTKRVRIVLMTESIINNTCCGFIGEKEAAFCIRPKNKCTSFLNGGKHNQHRFEPRALCYYICKTNASDAAWVQYTVLSLKTKNKLLFKQNVESFKTLSEWKALFHACNEVEDSSTQDEFDQVVRFMEQPPVVKSLKTPGKLKSMQATFKDEDKSFSFLNLDTDMTQLQLTDADLKELKMAPVPASLTNLILGSTSVLQKLIFQFNEIQAEVTRKAMLQDVSSD